MLQRMLEDGQKVIGIDNFNDYYDVNLKMDRSKILKSYSAFYEIKGSVEEPVHERVCKEYRPEYIIIWQRRLE